jgi:UDP-2,3-diacylglucosamine hydrolase
VARQVEDDGGGEGEGDGACPPACDGLRALAGFRGRGGAVSILVGNHDSWLGPYYEKALGLDLRVEPLDLLVHGIRVRLVHGHLLEPHRGWKKWMEGQSFLRLFRGLPGPAAVVLDRLLQWKNVRSRPSDERHYYAVFRRYADRCRGEADLVVVGHVHTPLDDHARDPRLVVLGGWHAQSSYLKIDDAGASLLIETDDALISR